MTITSAGYDGNMFEKGWADLFGNVAPRYGVVGAGDLEVKKDTTRERGIVISGGQGWCYGVMDTNDSIVPRSLDAQAAGTRYDLIVKRTDWANPNGGPTTLEIIKGGPSISLPTFQNKPGEVADQPLALVPVTAGQYQVGEIIDLRSWSAGGTNIAKSDLVRGFNNKLGTEFNIGGYSWLRSLDSAGQPAWIQPGNRVLRVGGLMAGASKPEGVPFTEFSGFLGTSTGAGGEDQKAQYATDQYGYGAYWFGASHLGGVVLPKFKGIYSVQLTTSHYTPALNFSVSLAQVSTTRMKWRARRMEPGTEWAHYYGTLEMVVDVKGWL